MNSDLESKLAALVSTGDFRAGAMHLGPSGSPAALNLILQEIDNTILPRLMEFSVGTSFVSLNVGGRRLRTFVAASDGLVPPENLSGQPLSADNKAVLHEVVQLLQRLIAQDGALTLVRKNELLSAGQPDAGVRINKLAELWDLAPNAKPSTKIETFIALIGSDFIASLDITDQSISNPQGNLDVCDIMEKTVLSKIDGFEKQLTTIRLPHENTRLAVLEGIAPEAMLICLVNLNDTTTLVATSPNSFVKIATAWGRI